MKRMIRDLASKDQHNLKLQFQVGLGIILFCFCLFTATIIYNFQKNLLKEETLRQAELVMTSLESTRSYIREVLRPRMYEELGEDRFIIEAMSTSYITRVVMDRFTDELPAFKYRRAAIAARNPVFEANEQEQKMIKYFRQHPGEQEWHGLTRFNSERYYTLYQPVTFKTSCLHCHGDPADAPAAINDSYGSSNGFQRIPDTITGIQSISIPVEISLGQIRRTSFRMFGSVLILAVLLYGAIWLLFHQLIITNLRDLLTLFRTAIGEGDMAAGVTVTEPLQKKGHREELKELFGHARTLVSHLQTSRQGLMENADNLEVMVAERTEALKRSESQLQVQVKKRNRELALHNTLAGLITSTETLETILQQVLHEIPQVVPVKGTGIYLYNRSEDRLQLKCCQGTDILPEQINCSTTVADTVQLNQQYVTSCDRIKLSDSTDDQLLNISVPLCCRDRLQGIMVITELPVEVFNDCLHALLLSIGRQIGQTIESFENIQKLRRSSELLQSVFDGISDPLILFDPDGTLKMVNQAFLKRHNLTMDEALGRIIDRLGPAQQCLFSSRLLEFDLQAREPHTEEIQLDDGSIFDMYLYPILNSDQTVRTIVCFARDVTGVKETERRIQQTEKLVAIGQLAAGVAHEINNPLGVILCYTDIIKENIRAAAAEGGKATAELLEDITVIDRHAGNCRRIVADLLDFSRTKESGRDTGLDRQYLSLNETVANVLSMVNQQFLKKEIRVETELDNSLPCCLLDDRRMKQVLLNLLMNAAQALGSQGRIQIRSRAENQTVVLEIEDNGPGIEKGILAKIFDPFFSTKEPGQGTGLGLSVSYGIIHEHDGEITVQSRPGQGTIFTIHLPCSQEKNTYHE
jgi:PAS domain S-box-containing protein